MATLTGSLLWTHFGISGPVALNLSRHWHGASASAAAGEVSVALNVCPGETQPSLEAWLQALARERPRAQVATGLASRLPAAVADVWTAAAGIAGDATLAHLTRTERRSLIDGLLATPLQVRDSRGYNYAEVTAGGVPLEEIDHRSMASRTCEGLYLVGEILDVDGRLGGFNFQWAWSSGWVAGHAMASAREAGGAAVMSASTPATWLTMHRHLLPPGHALDVACGRGRHALWLAEQGWHVTAVDRDAGAVRELGVEARRRGLPIAAESIDLEREAATLPNGPFDVIVVVHYLHRPLFPQLLAALRQGGVLVYETFTTAQAARGKPTNPDFLLHPGELRELVGSLAILESREGEFDGRDVAGVIARKR